MTEESPGAKPAEPFSALADSWERMAPQLSQPAQQAWEIAARDLRSAIREFERRAESAVSEPPKPIGHLHSNGDFCQERNHAGPHAWPLPLYAAAPKPAIKDLSGEIDFADGWDAPKPGQAEALTARLLKLLEAQPVRDQENASWDDQNMLDFARDALSTAPAADTARRPGWIRCPDCDGSGEHVHNDHNGDPQWDYAVPCAACNPAEGSAR